MTDVTDNPLANEIKKSLKTYTHTHTHTHTHTQREREREREGKRGRERQNENLSQMRQCFKVVIAGYYA